MEDKVCVLDSLRQLSCGKSMCSSSDTTSSAEDMEVRSKQAKHVTSAQVTLVRKQRYAIIQSSRACCRVGRAPAAVRLFPIRFISVSRFMARLFPCAAPS